MREPTNKTKLKKTIKKIKGRFRQGGHGVLCMFSLGHRPVQNISTQATQLQNVSISSTTKSPFPPQFYRNPLPNFNGWKLNID